MMHDPQFFRRAAAAERAAVHAAPRRRDAGRSPGAAVSGLICRLRTHAVGQRAVYNQGFGFSTCRRCGCDMIRSDSYPAPTDWKAVPRGFKIIWCDRYTAARGPARLAASPRLRWRHLCAPALLRDLLRIACSTLGWRMRDVMVTPLRYRQATCDPW